MRTVVFADSAWAQPAFEALLRAGFAVGLCTSRRPQSGASLRHLARLAGVPLLEVGRNELGDGVAWARALGPDLLLALTFPYMLPPEMLEVPRLGAFNVHGAKLPEYRGPLPVFWEILNREPEGAITVHRMDADFDHGPVVASQAVPIALEDTYGLHVARLAFTAVTVVERLIADLGRHGAQVPASPQDENRARFHRRPTQEDMVIRWEEQHGEQIRGLVKAGNPWNLGAFTTVRGINLRLTDVSLEKNGGSGSEAPGTILCANAEHGLLVNCRDGSALRLEVVSMDEAILPGRSLAALGMRAGERFTSPAGP